MADEHSADYGRIAQLKALIARAFDRVASGRNDAASCSMIGTPRYCSSGCRAAVSGSQGRSIRRSHGLSSSWMVTTWLTL